MKSDFWLLNWVTKSQSCSIRRKKKMNQEILQILEFPDFHITYKELQSDGLYKIISKLKKVYKNNPEYKAPSEIE